MSAFTTLMTPQGMQGLGALVFPKADPFEMNGFSRVSTGARRVVMAPSEQQLMALIMKERQDRFAQEGFSRVKNHSRIMTETGPQDFKTAEEYVRSKFKIEKSPTTGKANIVTLNGDVVGEVNTSKINIAKGMLKDYPIDLLPEYDVKKLTAEWQAARGKK
jgi:hypothetical protein